MSEHINCLHSKWKSIESQIRGTSLTFLGQPVTGYPVQALTMLVVVWDGCIPRSPLSSQFSRWWAIARTFDLYDLIALLDKTGLAILRSLDEDRQESYDGFKHRMRAEFAEWGTICGPLRELIAGSLRGNPKDLTRTLQCLWFLKKLNFTSDKLEEEALEKYRAAEESATPLDYTLEERVIIERWFPREDSQQLYEKARPHHGNGATRDAGADLMSKYSFLRTDYALAYLCRKMDMDIWPFEPLERVSKLCFVPKTYKGYRTISAEPASLMWYQEGCQTALRKYLRHHPLARRFDPFDQGPNRTAAQDGSCVLDAQSSLCTLDLSAASDSVSRWLVRAWFSTSSLYPMMILTRSTRTELPDGTRLHLNKFAPMGNALTFDVESITFCAIVEAAICECGDKPCNSRYRVYGDDIIVEKRYAQTVINRLEANGFKVNTDKSFCGTGSTRFRESCGAFYLNGYDVTPVLLSRQFAGFGGKGRLWQPQAIDLVNLCKEEHMLPLRSWILDRYLLHDRKSPPPIFSDGEVGVWTPDPTNYHLVRKWDKDLQCSYYTHGAVIAQYGDYEDFGDVGDLMLYEWLRLAEESPDRDPLITGPLTVPKPLVDSVSEKGHITKRAVSWSWKRTYCNK